MSPSISILFPSKSQTTELILLSTTLIFVTLCFFNISPPDSVILFANVSQSCPGPYLGYQNSSINDVSTFLLSGLIIKSFKTFPIESPLTLCEPQSAEI